MKTIVLALALSLSVVATSCGGGGGSKRAVTNQAPAGSTSTGAQAVLPISTSTGPTVLSSGPPSSNPTLTIPTTGIYLVGGSCTFPATGTFGVTATFTCEVGAGEFVYGLSVGSVSQVSPGPIAIAPLGPVSIPAGTNIVVGNLLESGDTNLQMTSASIWAMPVTSSAAQGFSARKAGGGTTTTTR